MVRDAQDVFPAFPKQIGHAMTGKKVFWTAFGFLKRRVGWCCCRVSLGPSPSIYAQIRGSEAGLRAYAFGVKLVGSHHSAQGV